MKSHPQGWESRLEELYLHVHDCHLCPQMDKEKSLRRVDAISAEEMDVMIISQSLAENQLRKSGVNFFKANGTIGSTGLILERFLKKFGRTVFPPRSVVLSNGYTVSQREEGLKSIYNSEITQCYPGKAIGKSGDRRPSSVELSTCTTQGFLVSEIKLIKPKLVLLMGSASYKGFYENVLKLTPQHGLTQEIETIVLNREIPAYSIHGVRLRVLPIQHASGANPRFAKMAQDLRLIEMIQGVL